MSDLMQAVPQDAPVMKAWTIYKSSDDFSNTRKWALHEEHVDGSLWVAFFKGYFACAVEAASTIESLQARVRELEEALKQGEVWFREYAEGHSRKGDTDKADRNYNRARFLQKALGASHE